ncbi:MAG: SMC-Scp complex subunit ScpB [Candidatus Micrarchaeia archaeon]
MNGELFKVMRTALAGNCFFIESLLYFEIMGDPLPDEEEYSSTERESDSVEGASEESIETQQVLEEEEHDAQEVAERVDESGQQKLEIAEGGIAVNPNPVDMTEEGEKIGVAFRPKKRKEIDRLRVVEAALFVSNKQLNIAELAIVARCRVKKAKELVLNLREEYEKRDSSIFLEFEGDFARFQLKPEYLEAVSHLSKNVGLSRKAKKMLAFISSKGEILQSELKKYFRGEIYAYITELKEDGFLTSQKKGNTRLLKVTKKFHDHFQTASA